ncbi:MAG: acyltransferase [Lachnospiraceae bacterium]|jgi:acyltransferase|nr:acyltransferase [Lachnospiraceae bacterium]
MERKKYIDVLRGFAMISVVLQHAINTGSSSLMRVLLTYHMPLFFFISGILMQGQDYRKISFTVHFNKLVKSIVFPIMTYTFIQGITRIIIDGLIQRIGFPNLWVLLGPLLNWFLVTLLLMKLICWAKYRLLNGNKAIIYLIAEILLFCLCTYTKIKYVQMTLCALIFGDFGYILKPYIEKVYYSEFKTRYIGKIIRGGVFGLSMTLTIILSAYNTPIFMYMNQYGNKIAFILIGLLGIIAFVDLSFVFKESVFLNFIGKNTMIIYVTHFSVYRYLREIVWEYLYDSTSLQSEFPYYWILFLAAMVLQFPIIYIANRFFPVLFGKRKK